MAPHDSHDDGYHPKDAVGAAIQASLFAGGAGAFVSTIQNTLTRSNIGAMGFLTKTGGTIAMFGAMGGAYQFTKLASANLRQKDDVYNSSIGGFLSGTILGLRYRSMSAVVAWGAMTSIVISAYNFTGEKLSGAGQDDLDSYEYKQQLRKNRRRPVEQTIEEIGEGRGVHGEGYAERRAALLKEKYGISVPMASASS